MFERKKKALSAISLTSLPEYCFSLQKNSNYLSCVNVKIPEICDLLCKVEVRDAMGSRDFGSCSISITALDGRIADQYKLYAERYFIF